MKLIPIESDATHILQLTRKDAFEILQFLAQELADETKTVIDVAVLDDEVDSGLSACPECGSKNGSYIGPSSDLLLECDDCKNHWVLSRAKYEASFSVDKKTDFG